MISQKHKVILIHPERTGGTAIEHLIRYNHFTEKGKFLFPLFHKLNLGVADRALMDPFKHIRASDYRLILGEQSFKEYRLVALLRHPKERILSYYNKFHVNSGNKFEDFLKGFSASGSSERFSMSYLIDEPVSFCIRKESYVNDLKTFCSEYGFIYKNIKSEKPSRVDFLDRKISDASEKLIKEVFHTDYELFYPECL